MITSDSMNYRFGRRKRAFNPGVPHYSALRMRTAGMLLPAAPATVDYASKLPVDLGMMQNDRLGDCTAAAAYHARQVWSSQVTGIADTKPDDVVLRLYSEMGYDPRDPTTDRGVVEQDLLTYWHNAGIPLDMQASPKRDQLVFFGEVDPRNFADIQRAIWECGGLYIGFKVPAWIESGFPQVWGEDPAGASVAIIGGHAVYLYGYDAGEVWAISWGKRYALTEEFVAKYVDEAYALVDPGWVAATGMTPLGMTGIQLEAQMFALRAGESVA